jgi:ribosomal protein S18 acetylase RimI-like enzyme
MVTDPTPVIDVRKAHADERAAVKATLTAAFRDEALFRWIHRDDADRPGRVHAFFDVVVEALAHHDDTWSAGPGVRGAALWVPFGQPWVADEEALVTALHEAAGSDAERLTEVLELMDKQHPQEPHAYLWFIGVVPDSQGRGIGNALMSHVLERIDQAGTPAYLESTSPGSKKLYEQHGFVARPHFEVSGGTKVWPMWREARTT